MDEHLPHPPKDSKSYIPFHAFYPLNGIYFLCRGFRSERGSRPICYNAIPHLQSWSPCKYWTLRIQVLWSESMLLFLRQPCLFLKSNSRLVWSLRALAPRTRIISTLGPETQLWFTKPSSTCKQCPNLFTYNF